MKPNNKEFLIKYAKSAYKKYHGQDEEYTKEDALCCALEELDDGWGIYIDPTREEYEDLLSEI